MNLLYHIIFQNCIAIKFSISLCSYLKSLSSTFTRKFLQINNLLESGNLYNEICSSISIDGGKINFAKSVTTPIRIGILKQIGGLPSITVVAIIITGTVICFNAQKHLQPQKNLIMGDYLKKEIKRKIRK
jgi:putative effector of murein hydrolase